MVDIAKINFLDIHYLFDYEPHDGQYGNFDSYVILCAFKIGDIYHSLCNARFNLEAITANNYGELVENTPQAQLFLKQNFYQNALFSYNIVLDLTWQLGWLFSRVPNDEIPTQELHDELIKTCTYERLLCYLSIGKQYKLSTIYENFYKYMVNSKMRIDYNYLKHRGAFYYNGLGTQYTHSMGGVTIDTETYTYPFVYRPEVNLSTCLNDFIELDSLLVTYIQNLIDEIMPSNYLTTNNILNGMLNYAITFRAQLVEYHKQRASYLARIKATYT